MDTNYDNLKNFIEKIKTLSFFDRVFRWKVIRDLLLNTYSDLQKLTSNMFFLQEKNN